MKCRQRRYRLLGAALVLVALALPLVACGDPDGSATRSTGAPDVTSTTAGDSVPGSGGTPPFSAGELSTFDDLADLAEAITGAGQPCTLEYEGLRDAESLVSLCVLGTSQATLRIWDEPQVVEELVASGTASGTTVYGANWTVDVRDPDLARSLATALGGAVAR